MPVLAVAAAALILLLILFLLASPSFRAAMHDAISGLPLIGGWLADNNERLIVYLYGRLATWANSALGALSNLIELLAGIEYQFAQQVENLASAIHENAAHIRYTVIPAAVRQAEAYSESRLATVGAELGARIAAARAEARGAFAAALAYSQREYLLAVGYAQQLAVWSAGYAGRLWASATVYAQGLFVRAETDARVGEARSEAYTAASAAAGAQATAQAFAVAIGYADQVGKASEGYAEALTGRAILRGDLENARTLAYATAIGTSLVAAVEAIERSPCMQQCEPLGNLGAQVAALDLAALIAFLIEAGRDPKRYAAEIRGELEPMLEPARAIFAGLSGPRA